MATPSLSLCVQPLYKSAAGPDPQVPTPQSTDLHRRQHLTAEKDIQLYGKVFRVHKNLVSSGEMRLRKVEFDGATEDISNRQGCY